MAPLVSGSAAVRRHSPVRDTVQAGGAAGGAGAGSRQFASSTATRSRIQTDSSAPPRYDVVRAYLRLLGPATPEHVAGYLDAPVKDAKSPVGLPASPG